MSSQSVCQRIPLYAADGAYLGSRSPESAQLLLGFGLVSATYGRRGHIKTLVAKRRDGASAIEPGLPGRTRYSYQGRLECGALAWELKRLGKGNELRPMLMAVVADCFVEKFEARVGGGIEP